MKFMISFGRVFVLRFTVRTRDEAIFAWTYTTDLIPKGQWEFEQWMTPRWEKEHGSYSVIDFREELEYGVTDNFQIALYLNHHYVNANDDVPVANPAHPKRRLPGVYETGGEDVHAGHDPATPFDSYHFESVSFEVDLSAAESLQSSDWTRALFRAEQSAIRKRSWNGRFFCKKTGLRTDSFGR